MLRLAAIALAGALAFLGLSLLVAQCLVPSAVEVVQPSSISHAGGNAYQIAVSLAPRRLGRLFEMKADNASEPFQSTGVVTESETALQHPYSIHADIQRIGNGRYSHWETPAGPVLIFSTTDNSDPRINGRQYVVSARSVLLPAYFNFVLLLPLALLILQRLLNLSIGLIIGIVATAAFLAWGGIFFDRVILAPDSTTYIQWQHIVPLGYPLFLSSTKAAFGTLGWTGFVQTALMILGCSALAWSVRGLEIVALFLLVCCTSSIWYAGWLLSEGLFIPLVLANLTAALLFISKPRRRYAILLAVTAALAMFVRPAGYYLPVGIVFLLIAMRGQRLMIAKWAAGSFIACIAGMMLINSGIRGGSSQSQIGRVLFTNVAFLFEPKLVSEHQDFAKIIDDALKPHREGYLKSTTADERVRYSTGDYNQRLTSTDTALAKTPYALREEIYLHFFMATVTKRPLEFANLVIDQTLEAWRTKVLATYGPFRAEYYRLNDDLNQMLEQIDEFKLPLRADQVGFRGAPLSNYAEAFFGTFDRAYRLISQKWLIYLIGIVTLLAIPVAAFRASAYWLSLAYCGVMIHGSILLTCATSVFIHRYAAPVDPIIMMAGALMLAVAISPRDRAA